MSTAAWRARIAQAAQMGGALQSPTRDGIVSSYDPDHFAVKVRLQPQDTETGWIPIKTLQVGAGWGIYAAPQVGDPCSVEFQEGDGDVGRVSGFLPNDEDRPPSVPAGEIWLVHKIGAFIKLQTDGTLQIEADAGIHSKGPWTHDGTLHTTQDITCDTIITATTDVVGGGKHLKTHTHGSVQSGSSHTSAPD